MTLINQEDIVRQARTWLDTKYHHQGRLKKSKAGMGGVDCIGVIVGASDELGIHDGNGKLLADYDEFNYSMHPERGRLVGGIQEHLRLVASKDKMTTDEMRQKIRIADIGLFRFDADPQHMGLFTEYPTGGLGLIHCNSSAGKVVEQPFSEAWLRMLTHVYRFKRNQLTTRNQ